jgi:hypothetical protein
MSRAVKIGYGISLLCHILLVAVLALRISAAESGKAAPRITARGFEIIANNEERGDGPVVWQSGGRHRATALSGTGCLTYAASPASSGTAGVTHTVAPPEQRLAAKSEPPAAPPPAPPPAGKGTVPILVLRREAAAQKWDRPLGSTQKPGQAPGKAEKRPDLLVADTPVQDKLKRRTAGGRSEGVHYHGGTPQSERAVERALHWLLAHQRDDGSWHFNHVTEGCLHYCTNPGAEATTTGATALAMLPFLGHGDTHKEGEYQDILLRGMNYLRNHGVLISYGNDLRDGSMYGHALATIALCEAYGMTHDPLLKEPAQGAIKFIVWAQDPGGGGWRYAPGEPGDTTVTGWMLMALKSGQMARLEVPTPSIFLAEKFLSSVQNEDGSKYGYLSRQPRPGTTAVGLLCRMYTGWRRDNPGLIKGVANLNAWGPSAENLYFNYYATQVMFHWAGPEWADWNRKMRDMLVATQAADGHAAGSWYFAGLHGKAGGRLYCTAMAAMILEVYYRHMPLYSEKAIESKF